MKREEAKRALELFGELRSLGWRFNHISVEKYEMWLIYKEK